MREAFTYMFKDTMFGKKAFTYWFICFFTLLLAGAPEVFKTPIATQAPTVNSVSNPFLIVLPLASILLYAILGGYYFTGIKAIFEQKNNIVLPFINPWKNPKDEGYQLIQSLYSLGAGGLFGVGLGNSTQKYLYLPESHTDFIFPIIVEELGAIAGVVIILLYLVLLYRLLRIAKNSPNIVGSIIAYGTFLIILTHIFINFLGILALIPLTGVPVPFLSYGGSFTLNLIILIFLCERVAIESKDAKLKRELERI